MEGGNNFGIEDIDGNPLRSKQKKQKDISPISIRKLTPIQMPHVDIDELKQGRKAFTKDEWLDITDDYGFISDYQDLQGIGMTDKLALPTLIALCSIALGKPVVSNLAVLGDITISGTMIKVDELANTLQVCLDSGAKKVLIPSTSFVDFASVPADLMSAFQLIPYQSAEDAVFKALGVE